MRTSTWSGAFPEALKHRLLEHAQDLGLRDQGEVGHLVEKSVPPFASSKRPSLRRRRR